MERSFDSYSWQTVERKATFIGQVLRGTLDAREMEDIGDAAMGMAETKAITSGDPMILEKANAEKELTRLERLSRAHQRNLSAMTYRARQADRTIAAVNNDEPAIIQAIDRATDTSGDKFTARIAGQFYNDRVEAGAALSRHISDEVGKRRRYREEPFGVIAEMGGHQILATQIPMSNYPDIRLELADVPRTAWTITYDNIAQGTIGPIRQIENRISALPEILAKMAAARDEAIKEAEQARTEMNKPFRNQPELDLAQQRLQAVRTVMAEKAQPPAADTEAVQATLDPGTPVSNEPATKYVSRTPRMTPNPTNTRTTTRGEWTHQTHHTTTEPNRHEVPQPDTGLSR